MEQHRPERTARPDQGVAVSPQPRAAGAPAPQVGNSGSAPSAEGPATASTSTPGPDRHDPTAPGPDLPGATAVGAAVPGWSAVGAVPELAGLLLSTRSVEGFLDDLAAAAAASSPVPMSCGITLAQQRRPTTVASSDALARSVDEGQYGTGQGPCLQALHDGQVVEVADFAAERRWGTYPAYALAFGVRSSLSVPLVADDLAVGALNLYAGATGVFDDAERARVQALAAQCSAVLSVVLRQARQVELTEQLRDALASRSIIDQAVGIIMGQQRCAATQAFAVLRTASQHRNRKLRDIAADVITSTSGQRPEPVTFHDPA